jgi:hypothetical protein
MLLIGYLFLAGMYPTVVLADSPATEEKRKEGTNQGLTLDEIARGLKSAAKNVEEEIPKIGSAIGNAVKKITEKEHDKPSQEKQTKPGK